MKRTISAIMAILIVCTLCSACSKEDKKGLSDRAKYIIACAHDFVNNQDDGTEFKLNGDGTYYYANNGKAYVTLEVLLDEGNQQTETIAYYRDGKYIGLELDKEFADSAVKAVGGVSKSYYYTPNYGENKAYNYMDLLDCEIQKNSFDKDLLAHKSLSGKETITNKEGKEVDYTDVDVIVDLQTINENIDLYTELPAVDNDYNSEGYKIHVDIKD